MSVSDAQKLNEEGSQSLSMPPKAFPDTATCRVKLAEFDSHLRCLNIWAWHCPYNLVVGQISYCHHRDAFEILARTKSGTSELFANAALWSTVTTDLGRNCFQGGSPSKEEAVKVHVKNSGV